MLNAFYGAFAPACFVLLGLWLVVVQIRMTDWKDIAEHRQRSYGVALNFALPGVMSLIALIDPTDPAVWRVAFAVVALGGAIVLLAVGGIGVGGAATSAGQPGVGGSLGVLAFLVAIVIYLLIGALALVGGHIVLRVEAVLLVTLEFLGFNAAWLLLFDQSRLVRSEVASAQHLSGPETGPEMP